MINIIDALVTAQFYVGIKPPAFNSQNADVNSDKAINILDALLIAQFYVGMIDQFPGQGEPDPELDYEKIIRDWAKTNSVDLTGYGYFQINQRLLLRLFPEHIFYGCYIRRYPVAFGLEDPTLGMNAIFAINKHGNFELIPDTTRLSQFYREKQIRNPDLKDAAICWLTLSQEFKNDGYYQFQISRDDIEITELFGALAEFGVTAISRVISGGEGAIKAYLVFQAGGILAAEPKEEMELIEGVRPICQSTKLLDPDPVVRKMAVRDLLVMGMAARPYLDTMEKTAAPELKKEMDRLWVKIVIQEEKRKRIRQLLD